jgi:hypothetical protein
MANIQVPSFSEQTLHLSPSPKTMSVLKVLRFACVSFALGVTADQFDPKSYASKDVITRDVAVIGGGSTGTYAAVNLQNLGKSIVLVEKENVLGGHTNTYRDPATGITVDYGLQAFWDSEFAGYQYPLKYRLVDSFNSSGRAGLL